MGDVVVHLVVISATIWCLYELSPGAVVVL